MSVRLFSRLLSALLFCGVLGASTAYADSFSAPTPAELDALLASLGDKPPALRLPILARRFLGAPYQRDPLGEGSGFDPDPRLRLDAFDCQTFVETLWALSHSARFAAVLQKLDAIRYLPGEPARYETRLHFPWLQWLPVNEARGFIVNRSAEIAKEAAISESKQMRRPGDCQGLTRPLCLRLAARFPLGPVRQTYIPLDWAMSHLDALPEGAFVAIVRQDRKELPYRIPHMGVIVKNAKGERLFLHASRAHSRVLEVPMAAYLENLKTNETAWPVVGLIVLEIGEAKGPTAN